MNAAVVQICVAHCRTRMQGAARAGTVADKFRAAVAATKDFHEVLSPVTDDDLFRGAFLATWDECENSKADQDRLKVELDALNALGALAKGVHVNMEEIGKRIEGHVPIGLRKIWLEFYPVST